MHFIKEIKFIKDGVIEDYDEARMLRFLNRLGIQKPQELLDDFCEEVNGMLRTNEVISTLERVAARKITPAKDFWEYDAAALYLAAAMNKDWNGKYPSISELKKSDKIHSAMLSLFDDYIEELDAYIKPERDRLFTYKAISLFHGKYCHDINLTGRKELPQMAYMRTAMFLSLQNQVNDSEKFKQALKTQDLEKLKEIFKVDIESVKAIYDCLSNHLFTVATPIMVNALTIRPQTSSCVLLEVGDSTESLLDVNTKLGTMSAAIAGTAVNVQKLRAKGSKITNGRTSGPIPFIKVFESTVSAWNQGGTRPGALCVYFQWWHPDVLDMLSLKSNGGTEENRARKLKYAIKINDLFIRKVMNDEEVALISPNEAPELYGVYGREFEERYEKYLKDPKTQKIRAREIWSKIFKERTETGNIYLFHEENVNQVSMLNKYIGTSNLCTEVVLPTQHCDDFTTYSDI